MCEECKEEIKSEIKTKICSKCGRELPMTLSYYKPDKRIKCGFVAQCRECLGFKFIENYKERFYWNDKTENRLKEIYYLYTNKEIVNNIKDFIGLESVQIEKKGNELGLHKSKFCLRTQNNKQLPLGYDERLDMYNRYNNTKEGYKMCLSCLRTLEDNSDYFFMKEDKLMSVCKECKGHNFTKILKAKEGHKYCIKCDRELPNNELYFPIDRSCVINLRNVCRECSNRHFMEEGYIPKVWWTDEENELLRKIYPHFTNLEIIKLYFPNETTKSLADKAFKLGKINKTRETMIRVNNEKFENYSGENSWNYGRVKSKETRLKLSKTLKEKYASGSLVSHWIGRIVSEEERQRMSERQKGL